MRIGMAFGNGLLPQGGLIHDNLSYAKQLGIQDIILHLPGREIFPSTGLGYWTEEDLVRVRKYIESFGLHLAAIENFPVSHWFDVLLDGPSKLQQMENLKKTISNMGKAGIPVMGYYFSLAGVWGRSHGGIARGDALTDHFLLRDGIDLQQPIPNGEVWGEVYDASAAPGFVRTTTVAEVWDRLAYFLRELVPVAAEAHVRLAAHPDDPPIPYLRQTGRLITHPDDFQQLIDLVPSYYNALEFCQGTISYMKEGNIYDVIEKYASQDRIAYVHIRNNTGRFPEYTETFMDDGDWDIIRCLKIYAENGFDGVIIPDHSPQVTCGSPALTGFAHAIGYLKAGIDILRNWKIISNQRKAIDMGNSLFITVLVIYAMLFSCCSSEPRSDSDISRPARGLATPVVSYLSPEESMKTFRLPDGYSLELVASEPMILEPVAITWDGNGRMYVAEMITYMQDLDATGEQEPRSRISLLEDTDNDGKMDKSTVFVDSLLLPRMIQCVDDELLVNESNSINISSYRDTNNDGKADEKKTLFSKEDYMLKNVNVEHQRSGLHWNIDNWMYLTVDPVRFRYTTGIMEVDTMFSETSGQWGLTHDDYGRLFFSSAGGEIPVLGCQLNPVYGSIHFTDIFGEGFEEVFPIIPTPDVQGGTVKLRPDGTLHHFTASCGQSIFRGDRLPKDLYGDYIVCDPVGRIIRRANVENIDGKIFFENAYYKKEFIASSDMNFRPVNTATGPDGNLYIVDMHRGIIQQGAWIRPGTYLREQIDSLGIEKNIGHGRIYRVVHKDFKPGFKPQLLGKDSYQLLPYLDHPNGWWRDNAQKQIIANGDKSMVSVLKQIAAGDNAFQIKKPGHLGRLHALWTLDGLDAIDKGILFEVLKDEHPQIRKAAILLSEPSLRWNDAVMLQKLDAWIDDPDVNVRLQLLLSLHQSNAEKATAMVDTLLSKNKNKEIFKAAKTAIDMNDRTKALGERLVNYSSRERESVAQGALIYRSTCSTCHGVDGKGLHGRQTMSGPALIASDRLRPARTEDLINILLYGLTGPVDGKTYTGEMPAMGANSDEWIASCINYLRYAFDSSANKSFIGTEDIRKIRSRDSLRNQPWTLHELKASAAP